MLSSTRVERSCLFFSVSVISCSSLNRPTLMAGVGSVEETVGLGGTDVAAGGGDSAEKGPALADGDAEAPAAEAEGAPTFPTAQTNKL